MNIDEIDMEDEISMENNTCVNKIQSETDTGEAKMENNTNNSENEITDDETDTSNEKDTVNEMDMDYETDMKCEPVKEFYYLTFDSYYDRELNLNRFTFKPVEVGFISFLALKIFFLAV